MKQPATLTGERIRELRLKSQMTQNELGEPLGKSAAHISYLELGERVCNAELLATFADTFNTSVDYLLGRTDNPQPLPMLADAESSPATAVSAALDAMLHDVLNTFDDTDKGALLRYYEFLKYQQRRNASCE